MHKAIFRSRIENRAAGIVRITSATYKKETFDVLREWEDGRRECRQLYFTPIGGYFVVTPREHAENWTSCRHMQISDLSYTMVNDSDLKTIYERHPDFHYVIDKYLYAGAVTNSRIFELLNIWKEHKEVELLIAGGFYQLAYSKGFYKIAGERRKKVLKFIRGADCENISFAEMTTRMKYGISRDEYRDFEIWKSHYGSSAYDEYLFLKDKTYQDIRLYRDYKKMAKAVGHDWNERYWKCPRNIRKAHDKVMAEKQNYDELKKLKELEAKQNAYMKAIKKVCELSITEGKWRAYIPTEVADIQKHADDLHQCLIRCDYVQKVINGRCKLLFIKNGERSSATAEILPDGTIGQFYGNEQSRNINPTKKAKELAEMWLKIYNEKKVA